MDPPYKIIAAKSLHYQKFYTVINIDTIIVPPPPPISNEKDWTINHNPYNDPRAQPISDEKDFAAAYHKGISFTLGILSIFLQLKYQENGLQTPFKTHPNTMAAALWAILVYFVAASGQICSPAAAVPRHCIVWSGNVVVASLASLLAADLIRPLLYGVFVLLSGGVSLLLLMTTPEAGKIV